MKRTLIALVLLCAACKGKPSLSAEDVQYVRTTIALLHARAQPAADSIVLQHRIDSVFRALHTTRSAYLIAANELSKEPERITKVYQVISDSIEKKH